MYYRAVGQGLNSLGARTDSALVAGAINTLANGANFVAAVSSPSAYVETYKNTVDDTSKVMSRAMDSGRSSLGTASEGVGYLVASGVGITDLVEAGTGVDTATAKDLSAGERFQRGAVGVTKLAATTAALGAAYDPAMPNGFAGQSTPHGSPTPSTPETPPSSSEFGNARFVSEPDGSLVDLKSTPRGYYKQPDGTKTHILQKHSHPMPDGSESFSHTHVPGTKTTPRQTRPVSAQDVKNIDSDAAVSE